MTENRPVLHWSVASNPSTSTSLHLSEPKYFIKYFHEFVSLRAFICNRLLYIFLQDSDRQFPEALHRGEHLPQRQHVDLQPEEELARGGPGRQLGDRRRRQSKGTDGGRRRRSPS